MENPIKIDDLGVFPYFWVDTHFYSTLKLNVWNLKMELLLEEIYTSDLEVCFASFRFLEAVQVLKCSTPSIGLHVALVIENLKIEGTAFYQELKQIM